MALALASKDLRVQGVDGSVVLIILHLRSR
jgi:hypothetical protein